jgi:hypothetical protein
MTLLAAADPVLFDRLFDQAERVRWTMSDVPWSDIDESLVDDTTVATVRAAVIA